MSGSSPVVNVSARKYTNNLVNIRKETSCNDDGGTSYPSGSPKGAVNTEPKS